MKMLSPIRVGLTLSMLGALVFGCDDGGLGDQDTSVGATGAGASAGSAGAPAGSGGSAGTAGAGAGGVASGSGGSAGSAAGSAGASGSFGNGGSIGNGGTAGGSAGSVGAGGTAGAGGAGGSGNDMPAPVVPGTCKSDLGGNDNASVTFYWLDQGTELVHCSYDDTQRNPDKIAHVLTGEGRYFGAINTTDYAGSAPCGACVEVTRKSDNRKVTITITDECPVGSNNKCQKGHIDLSKEAFLQIGQESEGYLTPGQISWKYVPCPTGETVHFQLKEPSNVNWNQILVSGARWAITKVEVRVGGTWVSAARQVYNYWEPPNGKMGQPPYRVRVTDVNGSVLEADLELKAGEQDSGQQFTCN